MRAEYAQRMMFHGIVVFLIGLVTGFFLYSGLMKNPQIGVITHLEGVLNGMFLVILGLLWSRMLLTTPTTSRRSGARCSAAAARRRSSLPTGCRFRSRPASLTWCCCRCRSGSASSASGR